MGGVERVKVEEVGLRVGDMVMVEEGKVDGFGPGNSDIGQEAFLPKVEPRLRPGLV